MAASSTPGAALGGVPVPSRSDASPPDVHARLTVSEISKTFGRNRALHGVCLEVLPGEVHGLIGQNGSGKSTLAKVLTGHHAPDPGGRIEVDGVALRVPIRPLEARAHGVAMVHQNLGLVDEHTALENLRVGRLRPGRVSRRISWRRERSNVVPVLERLGLSVPLGVPVARLSEEERATLAIARAVQDADDGGLIIFDESTRSLSRRTLECFYGLVDDIVATGTSVLLISHGLEEVIQAADRVTVLRDGQIIEAGIETGGLTEAELARLVLGRTLVQVAGRHTAAPAPTAGVTVTGLSGTVVRDIDLTIGTGEVVGVTGLPDGGYAEIPNLLAGATPASSGTITLPGARGSAADVDVRSLDVRTAMDHGIVLVPEGRENGGVALPMTVAENLAVPQATRGRMPVMPVDRSLFKDAVSEWIELLDVRPRAPELPVGALSGGNQQKVLLAKWLAMRPRLLILHEPTQAVDVGARNMIIQAIRRTAEQGCSVLVAGADENELALLCDRVLIARDGRIADQLVGDFTPDDIVHKTYAMTPRRQLRPSRRR